MDITPPRPEAIGRDFDEAHEHALRHARDPYAMLASELGLLVEPAGAAAWAACIADSASRSASLVIITGSNVRTTS